MDIKVGYNLTIEQTQKLSMTPELIQAIQILQLNTQELEAFVQEQVETNPVIDVSPEEDRERKDDQESFDVADKNIENSKKDDQEGMSLQDQINIYDYDDISYKQSYSGRDEENYTFEHYATSETTLVEHLTEQLCFVEMGKCSEKACRYIIECLDDNGYISVSDEEIMKTLKVDAAKLNKLISIIQGFDPPGVGARNLKECLIIQLRNDGRLNETNERIINDHLEDIAANRLGCISRDMSISIQKVQEIADMIKNLEPKPGRQFASQDETRYIVPDVIVEKINDKYVVTVNETGNPKLVVNSYYKRMMRQDVNDEKLSKYLTEKYNAASWLIKSIEQRKQTIYNVSAAVVDFQKDFFEYGPKYLKTMTLKKIAEIVGIHESTVSRAISGKYMQTPRGVFAIKYFFSSGSQSGGTESGVSSNSIKSFIKEIVDNEDHTSPYSDQTIVKLLEEKNIKISRRTVAKYRDEMSIPSSSRRKRY